MKLKWPWKKTIKNISSEHPSDNANESTIQVSDDDSAAQLVNEQSANVDSEEIFIEQSSDTETTEIIYEQSEDARKIICAVNRC